MYTAACTLAFCIDACHSSPAVSCVVQGDHKGADEMEAAVESVYHKYFPEKLAGLTDSDFKSYAALLRLQLALVPSQALDSSLMKGVL